MIACLSDWPVLSICRGGTPTVPPCSVLCIMSSSHNVWELILDDVNPDDTYAERTARGSPPESSAHLNGTASDDEGDLPGYGHSQFRVLSDFEKQHFHPLNVTPDRPCTAFFRAPEVSTKGIFDSVILDGIPARSVRCL